MQIQLGGAPAAESPKPQQQPQQQQQQSQPTGRLNGVLTALFVGKDNKFHGQLTVAKGKTVRLHHSAVPDSFVPKLGMALEFDISTVSSKESPDGVQSAVNVKVLSETSKAGKYATDFFGLVNNQTKELVTKTKEQFAAAFAEVVSENPEIAADDAANKVMSQVGQPVGYAADGSILVIPPAK